MSDKVDLMDHYKNNAETLFGSWGLTDTTVEYEDAWQNTYDTLGQKLGYRSKEHMRKQLKDWLDYYGRPTLIVASKIDKLKRNQVQKQLQHQYRFSSTN